VKRKDNFLIRKVGGENLLVPLGGQVKTVRGIVILNETGCYIWELLNQEQSFDALVIAVEKEYSIEHDRACADVQCFLDELTQIGLLI
jgi:hypothetical protein